MALASSATRKQISVLGINSRFGKTISFLLKQSPIVNRLVLYDESNTEVAHDLCEINTSCKVVVYNGEDQLRCAVKNADVIVIGDREDPGPNVEETISKAAPDVIKYAKAISHAAPKAIVLVAASPVNTMVSLFGETQVLHGAFDCDRVLGVTSVDTMRASTILAHHMKLNPEKVNLPVIGGSSPDTRIPLFSQSRPVVTVCKADLRKMTRMVKMSECELFKLLKRGDAMNKAYATVRLINSVMEALQGRRKISEIVLSKTCLVPEVDYFSLPVILGPRGIAHRFPIPTLTDRENILMEHAVKCMQVDHKKAVDILYRNAEYHHRQHPEKTKEYSDLLECDKRGIFVGALLDKLRIHKESCKPKLEYLLMSKHDDLVYPPECEPCSSPKLIKFVEPDPISDDGCCPIKLPCPPSPPKRCLTVKEPTKAKVCKIESCSCPYPPVVKFSETCKVCDKGKTPCEHYENCKNLYGKPVCCDNKMLTLETAVKCLGGECKQEIPISQTVNQVGGVGDQHCCSLKQNVGHSSNLQSISESYPAQESVIQEATCAQVVDQEDPPCATIPSKTTKEIGSSCKTESKVNCPYGMSSIDGQIKSTSSHVESSAGLSSACSQHVMNSDFANPSHGLSTVRPSATLTRVSAVNATDPLLHGMNVVSVPSTTSSHEVNVASAPGTTPLHKMDVASALCTTPSKNMNVASALGTTPSPKMNVASAPSTTSLHKMNVASAPSTTSLHKMNVASAPSTTSLHKMNVASAPSTTSSHNVNVASAPSTTTSRKMDAANSPNSISLEVTAETTPTITPSPPNKSQTQSTTNTPVVHLPLNKANEHTKLHSHSATSSRTEKVNQPAHPHLTKKSNPCEPICSSCANSICPNPRPIRKNINEAIDQCLSKICLVEGNARNKSSSSLIGHAHCSVTNGITSEEELSKMKHMKLANVEDSVSDPTSQHREDSVSPADFNSPSPDKTMKQDATIQQTVNASHQYGFVKETHERVDNSRNSNLIGGAGMSNVQVDVDPSKHFIQPVNHCSTHRENQYSVNDESSCDLKKRIEREKSAANVMLQFNDEIMSDRRPPARSDDVKLSCKHTVNDDQNRRTDSMSNTHASCSSNFDTILHEDISSSKDESKQEMDGLCNSTSTVTDDTVINRGRSFAEINDNETVSATKMRENIRATIHSIRQQNSNLNKTENTTILGFGQIFNALITTSLPKRKKAKKRKRSSAVARKLFVETQNGPQQSSNLNRGSALMLPVTTSNLKDAANANKNYTTELEPSNVARIKCKVQEALKSIIYPPPQKQKPADTTAKQNERFVLEGFKRTCKVTKDEKNKSKFEPVGHKLYAPKCPSRLIFSSHPDSRVITFNNVREIDVRKVNPVNNDKVADFPTKDRTERTGDASSITPDTNFVPQMLTFLPKKDKGLPNKFAFSVPIVHHYERSSVGKSVEHYENVGYWIDERVENQTRKLPSPQRQQYVQNQAIPVHLKSAISHPTFNKEYLKSLLDQKILREDHSDGRFEQLGSKIKERSKKVLTPGGVRLARKDDPKYGLTSPNRIMSNR